MSPATVQKLSKNIPNMCSLILHRLTRFGAQVCTVEVGLIHISSLYCEQGSAASHDVSHSF